MYVPHENGAIRIYKLLEDLNLIDLTKINPKDLPNNKNIKIGNIKLSLRNLFTIILGINHIKSPNNITSNDILLGKYKNTQVYKFYKLTYEVNRGDKTLNWLDFINKIKNKNTIVNLKKKDYNRLSDGELDRILLLNLKNFYSNIDGYYAPKINSTWSIIKCINNKNNKILDIKSISNDKKCYFYQFQEIALINNEKICLEKTIVNKINNICKYINY